MENQILNDIKPRVMVIDDHPDAADTLASLLVLIYDCTVNVAYSGREALALADIVLPELVILDVSMPHMDGFETAREMRARPWGQALSIIALTGWGDEETRGLMREAGMDIHLTKPVSMENLIAALAYRRP